MDYNKITLYYLSHGKMKEYIDYYDDHIMYVKYSDYKKLLNAYNLLLKKEN